jgi:hypothetical protein
LYGKVTQYVLKQLDQREKKIGKLENKFKVKFLTVNSINVTSISPGHFRYYFKHFLRFGQNKSN